MKTKPNKINNGTVNSSPDSHLHLEIERRAHNLWVAAGGCHGDDVSHWLQAENEVLAERRQARKEHATASI
jgi:Protein of unknown function (DUF2934)